MTVHHCTLIHKGTHVDVRRWHHNGTFGDVRTPADAGAAGHNSHSVLTAECADRESALVKKGELSLTHILHGPETKSSQYDFLDPFIYNPDAVFLLGDPDISFFKIGDKLFKSFQCYFHNVASICDISFLVESEALTKGSLTSSFISPRAAIAALAGIGLDSTKQALKRGDKQ